jgi:putative phage-type endonuclease
MEQGTNEWLAWRHKAITSSKAPIIMGKSKYMTRYQLWFEMIGEPKAQERPRFVQELGHKFEPKALGYIALQNEILDFKPTLFEHKEYDWLKASLDGYSEEKNIALELKYVGKDRFNQVKTTRKPLDDHWDQLQHILMVTGAKKLIYGVYTLDAERKSIDEIHWIDVHIDLDYVLKELFPTLKEFHEMVISGTQPELIEKDQVEISDQLSLNLADSYTELLKQKKEIDDKLKGIESDLKAIAEKEQAGKVRIKNLNISCVVRRGSVDYKKIPELKNVDLDKYRKAPSTYYAIRADK